MPRISLRLLVLSWILAMFGCVDLDQENGGDESAQTDTAVSAVTSTTVSINSSDLSRLQSGCYNSSGYLHWQFPVSTCVGPYFFGSDLSTAHKQGIAGVVSGMTATQVSDPGGAFPGECVSFVKSLASRTIGGTTSWTKGARVDAGGVSIGTAVVTFRYGDTYNGTADPPDHVAFFGGYSGSSFILYDQNAGNPSHLVMRHLANSPSLYYVLLSP